MRRRTYRCGACKGLKKSFVSNGDKLVDMSSKYVMVSVDGDDNNKVGVRAPPSCARARLSCVACPGSRTAVLCQRLRRLEAEHVVPAGRCMQEDLSPDGKYIPRIFFASPDGKVSMPSEQA